MLTCLVQVKARVGKDSGRERAKAGRGLSLQFDHSKVWLNLGIPARVGSAVVAMGQ